MDVVQLLHVALRMASPIMLTALGGMFAMRVGVFNIGLEGFMLAGCFGAVWGTSVSSSPYVGILMGMIVAMCLTLIYALFVLDMGVDPIIAALASIMMSTGLTRYLLRPLLGVRGRFILPRNLGLPLISIPLIKDIPFIGPIISNHSIIVYISWALFPIVHIILYRTSFGLQMRAVGEEAKAAMSSGINARRVRYLALAINGLLCGLAGAQLSLGFTQMFNEGMTNGRGFTALAALTLASYEPLATLAACMLFGISESFVIMFSGSGYAIQLLSMVPYWLTVIVAVIAAVLKRSRKGADEKGVAA